MDTCPHEDDILYGALKQVAGEPLYEVVCSRCKAKGIIKLIEAEEEWESSPTN